MLKSARELNAVKDAADVEERAQDDFEYRVFDSPAAKLIAALESFLAEDLSQALDGEILGKVALLDVFIDMIEVIPKQLREREGDGEERG